MTVRKAYAYINIIRGSIFLLLLNLAFGALVKAWLKGTIESYNLIGLAFLVIPMAILYGFLIMPLWLSKKGEPLDRKAEWSLYIALIMSVLFFIGGFYIDVAF